MINVSIEDEKAKKAEYPKLMVASKSGTIVLMYKYGQGTYILPSDKVGETSSEFVMSHFVDYKGEIKISNG